MWDLLSARFQCAILACGVMALTATEELHIPPHSKLSSSGKNAGVPLKQLLKMEKKWEERNCEYIGQLRAGRAPSISVCACYIPVGKTMGPTRGHGTPCHAPWCLMVYPDGNILPHDIFHGACRGVHVCRGVYPEVSHGTRHGVGHVMELPMGRHCAMVGVDSMGHHQRVCIVRAISPW